MKYLSETKQASSGCRDLDDDPDRRVMLVTDNIDIISQRH